MFRPDPMTDSPRYAIYYMPQPSTPLWRFGARVLGYDPARPGDGPPPAFPEIAEFAPTSAFADPAKYGFHATLKAPFELATRTTEDALLAQAATFAAGERSFSIGRLQLSRLDRFIALIPIGRPAALHDFADRCVRDFEPIRAPLSAADLARRLASPLSRSRSRKPRSLGLSLCFRTVSVPHDLVRATRPRRHRTFA